MEAHFLGDENVPEIREDARVRQPAALDRRRAVGGQVQAVPGCQSLQQLPGAGDEAVLLRQKTLVPIADRPAVARGAQLGEQEVEAAGQDLVFRELSLLQQLPLAEVDGMVAVQNGWRGVYPKLPEGTGQGVGLSPVEIQQGVVQVEEDVGQHGGLLYR